MAKVVPIVDRPREPSAPATEPSSPIITFDAVDLVLGGKTIVQGINLEIQAGEFVSVVGPSGCGKTTLLRLIAGFYQPTKGRLTYRGAPLTGPSADVAIVFQDYGKALLPWRTVYGNVSLALEATKVPRSRWDQRITAQLDRVGLGKHADKYPNQLSGGMQQRLQIARALAQEPSVLLMDEPFGALDAMTRQTLQDECLRIIKASGATVFFVTHDLEEAIYLGDRVIALSPNPGRIAHINAVGLSRPRDQLATREAAEFVRLRRILFDFIRRAES